MSNSDIIGRQQFIERLGTLADRHGGKAALAKLAGIAPTSLQNYFGETEPPRSVLFMLARATNVSAAWLAGEEVTEDGLPEGFLRLPFYDLTTRKNLIYVLFAPPSDWRIFKRDDLISYIVSSMRLFVVRTAVDFNWGASPDNDLLIDGVNAGDPTMAPKHWSFILKEGAPYLIARRSKALLRRIQKKKTSIELLDAEGRVDFSVPLEGEEDFLCWGPVLWRGGKI